MISIKDVSVIYENKKAVNKISLDIDAGKITGLIGPNGAGKSSLIKTCVGLISEYGGSVQFNSRDISKNRLWVKKHCGFAPEDTDLLPYLKGGEFLELIGSLRQAENTAGDIDFLIDLFSLSEQKNELIVNYSHGMRQKISIAAALIGQPDYLIFDEALNGLDPISLFRLKNHFRELAETGKTILLSSHILSLIRDWCDPVVIMDKGNIIKNISRDEIRQWETQSGQSFENYFVDLVR